MGHLLKDDLHQGSQTLHLRGIRFSVFPDDGFQLGSRPRLVKDSGVRKRTIKPAVLNARPLRSLELASRSTPATGGT